MEINFVKDERLEYANLQKNRDGSLYRGQFRKKTLSVGGQKREVQVREGYGLRDFEDGASYEGQWKENMPNGKGFFNYANGDSYSGLFKNGKRHGHGELFQKGKGKLIGYFENDEYVGKTPGKLNG